MKLKPIHKILLTTDGSISKILEAVTGKEIKIETVEQKIVKADKKVVDILEIEEGDSVNFRVVNIIADDEIVAHAISYTPLSRLDERFREDLMRADIPIGKIIKKHNLEVRREINWGNVVKAEKIADIFKISPDDLILSRNYNIIHRSKILINITEYFPLDRF
ncbi:MAG TPA: DUF98 domain-containing protein [Archaeoglobaceae archaeon]|nr:DUF98 domain-containing protein [Archaeoglobaceae archaeon]